MDIDRPIANLRHAYRALAQGWVREDRMREFADGLIAPAIGALEVAAGCAHIVAAPGPEKKSDASRHGVNEKAGEGEPPFSGTTAHFGGGLYRDERGVLRAGRAAEEARVKALLERLERVDPFVNDPVTLKPRPVNPDGIEAAAEMRDVRGEIEEVLRLIECGRMDEVPNLLFALGTVMQEWGR